MTLLINGLIEGILMGGVYALMSSGLTLIYGVMEIFNVAQGILVVLGAYLSFVLSRYLHIDIFLGLLITVPVMFLIGMGIEWAFVRRLQKNRIMLSILVTYAVSLLIEGLLNLIFTPNNQQLQAPYVDTSFFIFGFYLPYIYVFAFLLSVALLAVLFFIVYRTGFGASLRATMQNRTAAALVGIDVKSISTLTFGLGVAAAAVGGMVFGATNAFNAASSYDLISRLLVIIILGGMGSLRGALLASLLMLVISDVTAVLWSSVWSSTVFFVLLIVLLIIRPQGLFGALEVRKQ